MNIIYAIYKENLIPTIGGVNPEGIEIGLAEYNEWKLCGMEESEFNKFSEFSLYPVPKSIAVGMVLMKKQAYTSIQEDMLVMPAHVTNNFNTTRTDEEEVLVQSATEYLDKLELKFITRSKIRQFKDFEDDLSDTKLLIEFLLLYIAEDYETKSVDEKSSFQLKEMMDAFLLTLEGKNLRINNEKILNKVSQIIKDESFISRIVKENYVDKIKNNG